MVIKRAVPAEVERLVRLMEAHCDGDQWQRLRAAAKAWEDNGGKLSSPVVAEDDTTPSPVAPPPINRKYNVHGLCREVPDQLCALVHETGGDRLPKFK